MNWKKFWIGCVVVYIGYQILGFLIHGLWLSETYGSLADVWRPETELMSKRWIFFLTSAVWSFFFCYIFVKGREGKGLAEGARFGAIIGLFFAIPQAYESYALLPIPHSLALSWFLSGLVASIILGVIFSALYNPD